MTRRLRPAPECIRIEGLSDGRDAALRDDFTGEAIPQPGAKAPPSAQSVTDAAHAARHRENQLLLQAAGIVPKPVAERTRAKTIGVPAGVRPLAKLTQGL
jgi:hypothetical protein